MVVFFFLIICFGLNDRGANHADLEQALRWYHLSPKAFRTTCEFIAKYTIYIPAPALCIFLSPASFIAALQYFHAA